MNPDELLALAQMRIPADATRTPGRPVAPRQPTIGPAPSAAAAPRNPQGRPGVVGAILRSAEPSGNTVGGWLNEFLNPIRAGAQAREAVGDLGRAIKRADVPASLGNAALVAMSIPAVPEIKAMWKAMARADAPPLPKVSAVHAPAAQRMARVYETLPSNDADAAAAYRALVGEVNEQYAALERAGYHFDFVDEDPYPGGSREMIEDMRTNRRLRVFKTNDENPHPYLTKEENDRFRAVHDALAHAGGGNQFGPIGEENAYRIHARTLSPMARRALATETRGQNSWVNFGPNSHLPVKERPYAEQKAALWPEEFTGDYDSFPAETSTPTPRPRFQVFDTRTGETMGEGFSKQRMRNKADRLDSEFGGARYSIRELLDKIEP